MENKRIVGILLCAGSARRMGFDKLQTPVAGKTAIERSMEALAAGGVTEMVFVVSDSSRIYVNSLACPVPCTVVQGGDTRHDSVKNALEAVSGDIAVIHDAARCLVSPELVRSCISAAEKYGSGIAAVPVTDTVFRTSQDGFSLVDRDGLFRMQTPQVFQYDAILRAYRQGGGSATDDCTLFLQAGNVPHFVPGSEDNFKLTLPSDFARAEKALTRYGTGFDTHRLTEGRRLILGGVDIPFEKGLLGHSDADVLVHAIMDALLGAGGLPDIGHLFPDSDPDFLDADSMKLLKQVVTLLGKKGLRPRQVSAVIIAQRPKMAPYLDQMIQNLSAALNVPAEQVSISATTTEGMNDEGRGLCISARAIAAVC